MPGSPSVSPPWRVTRWVRDLFGGSPETEERTRHFPAETEEDQQPPIDRGRVDQAHDEGPAHRATTQLLPGRLEPLNPEIIQQEVRFFRNPEGEQTFTLGWEIGDPADHVTLDHPSVRPIHARMTYEKGSWMIESTTSDPVRVNGKPIPESRGPYLLANGDEVTIGKATFRFFMP